MNFFKKNINLILIIFFSLAFLFIAAIRLQYFELDHGDEFADANVLTAGKNFAKFGFIRCKFLPHFGQQLDPPKRPYLHYPPLPEIINGIFQSIFKIKSLRFFRAISLFFSFLNFIFFYLFVRKITKSFFYTGLASLFFLVNPYFIFGIDSLHQMAFADFFRTVILFCFITLNEIDEAKRRNFVIFLWILFFIEALLTFEYIIYLILFFILYKYLFKQKNIKLTYIMFLCTAAFFALLLHFLQNAWYFKDFDLAYLDFGQIAKERILQSKDMPMRSFNFFVWWEYVIVKYFKSVFVFSYFLLFFSGFLSYLVYQNLDISYKIKIKLYYKLFVILFICGISWYVIFPAHSFAHAFVPFLYRHIVPAAALWFAIFFYSLYIYADTKKGLISKMFVGILIIFVAGFSIINSELPISKQKRNNSKDFLEFKNCLLKLKSLTSEKDLVATNYYRFPFIRYYLDRDVITIFDKKTLDEVNRKPKYFIFFPYNSQETMELLQYLGKENQLLFDCNSAQFPTLFFKLKEEKK